MPFETNVNPANQRKEDRYETLTSDLNDNGFNIPYFSIDCRNGSLGLVYFEQNIDNRKKNMPGKGFENQTLYYETSSITATPLVPQIE